MRLIGDGLNLGFAKGANLGIETARGDYVLLLGNDAYVTPGALPAMARIAESLPPGVDLRVWAEAPAPIPGYFPEALTASGALTWLTAELEGSGLASVVESLTWPSGAGHFWMAGESAQMRAIRRHLMHDLADASFTHDVMGYWRHAARAPRRAADPGPVYRAGKAAGKSDAEIWADYDAQRD